ncbi:MAG: phosphoenolpyruvate--protein phosphotransferase [Halothiobacillus sp. 24-54-40]|jgi:phosphotransferase system enzyme I (PtsP)|nr:MAG: phosphoenolpyruvate--protein phosphotransferase [Halothiobacillus sp. 35-54-62]OYZ87966.1 MAG: phosphoenolpyruvate--protein phosphotransferase [Halothiobacillus sp. 24-54-40]OZA81416.1 MAG: phosphoenolpyruvate--protein phosphotransferase [Halothiobacillus sp. 39-53-45]HQS02177.1 phosphoenolpyruvate--protein phosphotransferase [Halothiobacillus sp.]HQS28987.1 phosphoenolpyruvate--protein phosphotransferase [Halothiobacillus sp.]
MLDELRRIVTEVAQSVDLRAALDLIARRVKDALSVDVCSVYVLIHPEVDQKSRLVMQATEGLNQAMIGTVSLALNEGLVGLVARRAELVNLENAPDHPAFKFVSDIGEEFYHGFLGVPIIYRGDVLGVLVVQSREQRRFSSDQESFLVTLASQLASGIRQAEVSGELSQSQSITPQWSAAVTARGLPGSPGVVFGTAVSVLDVVDLEQVVDRVARDPADEWAVLMAAVQAVRAEFAQLKQDFAKASGNEDENILFDAFILMLSSGSLLDSMESRVNNGQSASAALRDAVREHTAVFEKMSDPYLRERAQDIRDLGSRVLVKLKARTQGERQWPERIVLIGRDLSASHLAEIPTERLVGIVSSTGSGSSHLAILARALGIPAAMGVADLPISQLNEQEVVVDGYRGLLIVRPAGSYRQELLRLAQEETELTAELMGLRDVPAETTDGVKIGLHVNIGLLADMAPSKTVGAEGIGLYRTEVPFQIRKQFPGEAEQTVIYREALEAFRGKSVVLRTLDVGGDKPLSYFPIKEDNPFLGWRGIRLVLDHPEIFLTQIRAMLKASIGLDNLSILLPMIGSVDELQTAKEYIDQAFLELREEGEPVAPPRIGVMIEVPSAVYQIEFIAAMVDFLSIGTNDLTQYILAIDRNNERVAARYDALHPAVLRAIVDVVDAGHLLGREITVCGELAGDPMGAVLLLGMGIDILSMSAGSLPRIKWVIRSFTHNDARKLLAQALNCRRPGDIRQLLYHALTERGLGGLVRAGR